MPLLEARHIRVTRQQRVILDDVSLSVGAKEFITIIGPNGAGKTMLLHVLMGLLAPDSGEVARKDGLRIGYVPQRLVPDAALPMSTLRFLTLVKGASKRQAEDMLDLVDARDMANQQLYKLSGGELQRVLLARALLQRPDLLVLDEPAQNLDIGGQLAFYKLLEVIYRERGCSILMVSHDLHMVMASTSRVICLFHHICCSGTPSAVTKDPQFTALFGADMARMMSVYHHAPNHDHRHDHTHDHMHHHTHSDARHDH